MTDAAPWWIALSLSSVIALSAWRAKSLRESGAIGAFVIGVIALRSGWSWGAFLIVWFVLASLLSRIGRAVKSVRTRDIVAKSEQRDGWQVLANGGVFATCALASMAWPTQDAWLTVGAAGALAAAGADTWSTEVGTLLGGTPWSLRANERVPVGTSGAVTWRGTFAGLVGAAVLASLAFALAMIPSTAVVAVAIGGMVGALADTVLGAWCQERRYCPQCQRATERLLHSCGATTVHTGGIARMDNDVVNALATIIGAAVAAGTACLGL